MALINSSQVDFNDVRLIVCLNGFTINETFQIVELGFWSRKFSGVIPFKSTKSWSKLNHLDKLSVNYLTSEYHGIGLDQLKNQNALHQSDIFGALRAIYHLTDDGVKDRKLIGYLGNQCLLDILGKMGIGGYLVNIKEMCSPTSISIDQIRSSQDYGWDDFEICNLHNNYVGNDFKFPVCAKSISCYLANYFMNKIYF